MEELFRNSSSNDSCAGVEAVEVTGIGTYSETHARAHTRHRHSNLEC